METATHRLLVFEIGGLRCGLGLEQVKRAIRAVEVTPLPGAPDGIAGIIDVAGSVMPAYDLRQRFKLAPREIAPTDQFLVAACGNKDVVILAERIEGILESAHRAAVPAGDITAETNGSISGVIQTTEGLILIHDLERFLSPDESDLLAEAMMLAEGDH
jgi:purine-binding chemotaxis protein CheW